MKPSTILTKSVIDALWNGTVSPQEREILDTPEMSKLIEQISNDQDQLSKALTPEQADLLDRIDVYHSKYTALYASEVFSYAFKLGGKMMLEMLATSKEHT